MMANSNKQAGIITIYDLPQKAMLEIRDLAGNIVRSFRTITPSLTVDSDHLQNGEYRISASNSEGSQTLLLLVVH